MTIRDVYSEKEIADRLQQAIVLVNALTLANRDPLKTGEAATLEHDALTCARAAYERALRDYITWQKDAP